MIYITGDRHGDMETFTDDWLPDQENWGEEDVLIITGDFGFVWCGEDERPIEKEKLDSLARKPYMILFCDGNHEGFDSLEKYSEMELFGAPVRKIRDNIYWLQRGYVYRICNKNFFVFGGAHSMDKARRLSAEAVYQQKLWFPQELPTQEEYARARRNLAACDRIDYVITHTAPRCLIRSVIGESPDYHDKELTDFLQDIYLDVPFKHWYFGHFHVDMEVRENATACLKKVHRLDD